MHVYLPCDVQRSESVENSYRKKQFSLGKKKKEKQIFANECCSVVFLIFRLFQSDLLQECSRCRGGLKGKGEGSWAGNRSWCHSQDEAADSAATYKSIIHVSCGVHDLQGTAGLIKGIFFVRPTHPHKMYLIKELIQLQRNTSCWYFCRAPINSLTREMWSLNSLNVLPSYANILYTRFSLVIG